MLQVPLDGLEREVIGLRVAVTGADGYLGRTLVQALRNLGCAVRACDIRVSDPELYGARWKEVDVRDPAALAEQFRNVDVVFHTAAVHCGAGMAPRAVRDRVWSVNVEGTRSVIEACREAGVDRLVYTSSASVVIDRELEEADESAPYARRWADLYGPSKAEAERLVLDANDIGLHTLALRPGPLWGPGDGGPMIREFLAQLARGRFRLNIGDGHAVVDHTHVFSLARAELLAATALAMRPERVGGKPYFITDDERLHGVDWFRPLVAGLGREFPAYAIPAWLAYSLAWFSEVGFLLGLPEPPLTRSAVLRLTRSSSFKVDAARRDLGYEPLVTGFEGLQLHLEDYRRTFEELRGTGR